MDPAVQQASYSLDQALICYSDGRTEETCGHLEQALALLRQIPPAADAATPPVRNQPIIDEDLELDSVLAAAA